MDTTLVELLNSTGIDMVNFTKESAINLYRLVETEAPLLLQEWIQWNFWSSLLVFVLGVLFLLVFVLLVKYTLSDDEYNNKYDKWLTYEHDNILAFTGVLISKIGFLIAGLSCIGSNLDWLQIWIAPRVWILENIKDLF